MEYSEHAIEVKGLPQFIRCESSAANEYCTRSTSTLQVDIQCINRENWVIFVWFCTFWQYTNQIFTDSAFIPIRSFVGVYYAHTYFESIFIDFCIVFRWGFGSNSRICRHRRPNHIDSNENIKYFSFCFRIDGKAKWGRTIYGNFKYLDFVVSCELAPLTIITTTINELFEERLARCNNK